LQALREEVIEILTMRTVTGRSTTLYLRTDLLDKLDRLVAGTSGAMNRSEIVNAALDAADLGALLHERGLTDSNS
jgi:hypothetical protein